METLNLILVTLTLVGSLGTLAGWFYGSRQKATISLLEINNKAYAERVEQQDDEIKRKDEAYAKLHRDMSATIAELQGRVHTLEMLKTPDIEGLKGILNSNHTEFMGVIKKVVDNES